MPDKEDSFDHETADAESASLGRFGRWIKESRKVNTIVFIAETIGKLAIVYTIVNYLMEAPERQKIKEFQAWQVINTAHSGDGGRSLALRDLNQDGVDLENVDLSGVVLGKVDLRGIRLDGANLRNSHLTRTDFSCPAHSFWKVFTSSDCDSWGGNPYISHTAATFRNTDFTDSFLFEVNFKGSYFGYPKIGDTANDNGPSENIYNCNFDATEFEIHIKNSIIVGSRFRNAYVLGSTFDNVSFVGTDFRKAYFGDVSFNGVKFPRIPVRDRADLQQGLSFYWGESNPSELAKEADRAWNIGAPVDFTDAEFGNEKHNKYNTMVYFDGHEITEDDLKDTILCRTKIQGKLVNRDC